MIFPVDEEWIVPKILLMLQKFSKIVSPVKLPPKPEFSIRAVLIVLDPPCVLQTAVTASAYKKSITV